MRRPSLLSKLMLVFLMISLLGCSTTTTPTPPTSPTGEPTAAVSPYPPLPGDPLFPAPTDKPATQQVVTPYPAPQTQPSATPILAQATQTPTQGSDQAATQSVTSQLPTLTKTPTETANSVSQPALTNTSTPEGSSAYPGPGTEPTQEGNAYPGPQVTPSTSVPTVPSNQPTLQPSLTALPTDQPTLTSGQPTQPGTLETQGAPTSVTVTPQLTGTATVTLTPTEGLPAFRPTVAPDRFTTITIWHSLEDVHVLEQAIQAFQSSRPNVTFTLRYLPFDDLEQSFTSQAYYGGGPTLVLGPSAWGAGFYQTGLVEDISDYISSEFAATLNGSALGTVEVGSAVFGLPYGLHGPLLYRNQKLIDQAAPTWDEMLKLASRATRAGNVGLYLDWGMPFSGGFLQGVGGRWLDDSGAPLFQRNNYQSALRWLDIMQTASSSGALVEFNGTRDLTLFKQGKIGLFVEDSSLRFAIAQALGEENLMIDAWPKLDSGRLTGFVESDVVYLNTNAGQRQPLEKEAGLQFMGLLMTAAVQQRLAEQGIVPAVRDAQPRNRLTAQAAAAFETGVPYPAIWQSELRARYGTALNAAAQAVYEKRSTPLAALQSAFQQITNP